MPETEPNETLELVTTTLASSGAAVARHQGKAVFVYGAAPEERVLARITRRSKRYDEAELVSVVSPSPDRVEAPCPLFGSCGGCMLQHVRYERQVQEKHRMLDDALTRVGGQRFTPIKVFASPKPYGTRLKARMRYREGKIGFFSQSSHDFVAFDDCPALEPELNALLRALRSALVRHAMKEAELEAAWSPEESLGAVALELEKAPAGLAALLERDLPKLKGVALWAGHEESAGNPVLRLDGVPHDVRAFWQAHAELNRQAKMFLANEAKELMQELERPLLMLELFAGSGNLSSALIPYAARLIAVETEGLACRSLTAFSRERDWPLKVIRSDVENGLERVQGTRFDLVVLDPPRAGLENGMELLVALQPRKILYQSCDPATLARDVKKLAGEGYALRNAAMFDFFPQTRHVEAVAVFVRSCPNGAGVL